MQETATLVATFALDPGIAALAALVVGLWCLRRAPPPRAGLAFCAAAFAILLAGGIVSVAPSLALGWLEDRFPPWPGALVPAGMIVLGGGLDPGLAARWPGSGFNAASGRMLAAAVLAHRHPELPIIYAGGGGDPAEATVAADTLAEMGIPRVRFRLEARSRTTAENAAFATPLMPSAEGRPWLLITSAFHMPRAMGAFRAQGAPVAAYPVDYRSKSGDSFDPIGGLLLIRLALKEAAGLAAYRWTGRSDALFPAP